MGRERERERTSGLSQKCKRYFSLFQFFFSFTYFVSCNGPFVLKEKWHRKEHIIIIIINRTTHLACHHFLCHHLCYELHPHHPPSSWPTCQQCPYRGLGHLHVNKGHHLSNLKPAKTTLNKVQVTFILVWAMVLATLG